MISAVIMAAGQSKRMGKPKINLPWMDTTILGRIVWVLDQAGIDEIVCVIGKVNPSPFPIIKSTKLKIVRNPQSENSEMLSSLKIGIRHVNPETDGVFVVLGDQPQIEVELVEKMIEKFHETVSTLIVPSYKMRRGHPWFIRYDFVNKILELNEEMKTLRDFLEDYSSLIYYLSVNTETILKDIDTPFDYDLHRKDS